MLLKRTAQLIFILFLLLFKSSFVLGQETNDSAVSESSNLSLASKFSSGFDFDGTTPKITAQSIHVWFHLDRNWKKKDGADHWDLYLFNSVPTLALSQEDSLAYLSNDIRKQLGGIANISIAKVIYLGNKGDVENQHEMPWQIDMRVGFKMVDVPIRRAGQDYLIPIFQNTIEIRKGIALFSPKKGKAEKNIGDMGFRIRGALQQVLNTTSYDLYYTTKKGLLPPTTLLSATFEYYLNIVNIINLSVGKDINNVDFISQKLFLSVTVGLRKDSN